MKGSAQHDETADTTQRLSRASWAHTTRCVPLADRYRVSLTESSPTAGDLVLARVDALGHHRGLQLRTGRRKALFLGDMIVAVYGNRYAPNQFEAIVPDTLGPCHLVAGGGVVGKALSWHDRIVRGPTLVTPVGLLVDDDGVRANLRRHAFDLVDRMAVPAPPTIAVLGTAMDSGKTSAAAFLVKGLTNAGRRVGYAKVTGTGAGGDTWLLHDAGADPVFDFLDVGFVSTYKVPQLDIERIFVTLMSCIAERDVDAIVLEVADGILQGETTALLDSRPFRDHVSGVLFAARDAMGALAGIDWLRRRGLPIAGLAGLLTAAPLQRVEAFEATAIQTYSREELAQPDMARAILEGVAMPAEGTGVVNAANTVTPPVHHESRHVATERPRVHELGVASPR